VGSISYTNAEFQIRPDFAEGHDRFWKRLAAPGNWLTGAQRVDIAKEVRAAWECPLCRQRKEALSPYAVDGNHTTVTSLSDVTIDVVHRITTDPGRLTKVWFDGVMAQGLSPEEYVEIVGTVSQMVSIDEFCRGMGLPPNELPEPLPGQPSRYHPDKVSDFSAWVPMLPTFVESGPEADLWNGRGGAVIRALSLVPDEVRSMLDLLEIHYLSSNEIWNVAGSPKGTLSRIQAELIASRVSALNGCFY
jgi:hypothetical protein